MVAPCSPSWAHMLGSRPIMRLGCSCCGVCAIGCVPDMPCCSMQKPLDCMHAGFVVIPHIPPIIPLCRSNIRAPPVRFIGMPLMSPEWLCCRWSTVHVSSGWSAASAMRLWFAMRMLFARPADWKPLEDEWNMLDTTGSSRGTPNTRCEGCSPWGGRSPHHYSD